MVVSLFVFLVRSKKGSKLAFGTIGNEFAASDLPPEGQQKKEFVGKGILERFKKCISGRLNSSPGRPIFPQRVRKKGVCRKRHVEKLQVQGT